jgi:hypothetical protein
MTILKEKLTDIKEKFEKCIKLIEEESKNDPVTEPYQSHYKARDILRESENNLKNILGDIPAPDQDSGDHFVYRFVD